MVQEEYAARLLRTVAQSFREAQHSVKGRFLEVVSGGPVTFTAAEVAEIIEQTADDLTKHGEA
jgi:hypothetical protein